MRQRPGGGSVPNPVPQHNRSAVPHVPSARGICSIAEYKIRRGPPLQLLQCFSACAPTFLLITPTVCGWCTWVRHRNFSRKAAPGLLEHTLNGKSYSKVSIYQHARMARPRRFELLTPRSVVWCSIQLSYGRPPEARDVADRAAGIKCSGGQLVQLAQDGLTHHAGADLGRARRHYIGGP